MTRSDESGGRAARDQVAGLVGPRSTLSMRQRRVPLAEPRAQLDLLGSVDLAAGDFQQRLRGCGWGILEPQQLEIFQINIGRLCNMTCRHCHVDAGPDRVFENMDRSMIDSCLRALDATSAHTVDITGGAPELNPNFKYLVDRCVERGLHVIDRCNLTVLLLPRFAGLADWLGERGVEIVASLPHHRRRNTDAQRGEGTFERSVVALRLLNEVGYGMGDPNRVLTLMHNPAGAFLPGDQAALQRTFARSLERSHGVRFDRLIALNNMPIARFLEWLTETGNLGGYMERLTRAFNPRAVAGLMCRNTLSVGWDGALYDCDFNQMLALPIRYADGSAASIEDFRFGELQRRSVVTDRHCFGCTAGAGSSCGGATG